MKFFKNFIAVLMAMLLSVGSVPMMAMAAEVGDNTTKQFEAVELVEVEYDEDGRKTEVYEFDIVQEGEYGIMPYSLDQSFTMGSYHRGADRSYSGRKLQYSVTVTDVNGNAVDNMIAVDLHDYNHSYGISGVNVKADGATITIPNISITPGRLYYFEYTRISGASRTLKVRMRITDYN